jgi:osmotically-inducible protein OsmY
VAPPRIADGSALHGGAVTPADNALLGQVLSALDSAPHMEGSTVTVVANNGAITMNGSAKDLVQAGRIERIAKGVAGANVTAMIDPQGA